MQARTSSPSKTSKTHSLIQKLNKNQFPTKVHETIFKDDNINITIKLFRVKYVFDVLTFNEN